MHTYFAKLSDVSVSNSYFNFVEPDTVHPSVVIDLSIFFPSYLQSQRSFHKYAYGDYTVLYTFLSSCDWSYVYNESSVDTAVTQLNSAVTEAMDLAVPYKHARMSKYPCWFPSTLKYYM
jgi:hypothetical protein